MHIRMLHPELSGQVLYAKTNFRKWHFYAKQTERSERNCDPEFWIAGSKLQSCFSPSFGGGRGEAFLLQKLPLLKIPVQPPPNHLLKPRSFHPKTFRLFCL